MADSLHGTQKNLFTIPSKGSKGTFNSISSLEAVWAEQVEFNRLFRKDPINFEERSTQTKEMVLFMISELSEVLQRIEFKTHRKATIRENRPAIVTELTDIFKYLVSLNQIWDVGPDEFLRAFWQKSMVCRQRYSEEFLTTYDDKNKIAVIDIDGVLCDYAGGMVKWLSAYAPRYAARARKVWESGGWVNAASMEVPIAEWQNLKHVFRCSGYKARMPVIKGAREFLHECQKRGLRICLLTSRPIQEYPNMYIDTLEWLDKEKLPYDFLWWAHDKPERLAELNLGSQVQFALDDDERHIKAFELSHVRAYHFTRETRFQNVWDKEDADERQGT